MRVLLMLLLLPLCGLAQLSTHSRGAGMGDVGIAAASGQQHLSYNVGKTVFTNHLHQASVTYLPYLRALFNDTKFIRADYLTTTGESTTLGVAINYLDLGNITTRDNNGASLAIYRNVMFNISGSVGVRLWEHSGIGTTIRLVGARSFDGGGAANRYGVAGDIQYYQSVGKFSLGAVINNLGSDLWQNSEIGLGLAYSDRDDVKEWTIGMDMRKPLKDNFSAVRYAFGAELGFAESFFIRSGLSLENRDYGNRKYISLGAGYKGFVDDQSWSVDLHYLAAFGMQTGVSPFQHVYGISLSLNIGNFQ